MTKIKSTTVSITRALKNAAFYLCEKTGEVLGVAVKVVKKGVLIVYENLIRPGVHYLLEITKSGVRMISRHKGLVTTVVIVAGVAYVLYRVGKNAEEQMEHQETLTNSNE